MTKSANWCNMLAVVGCIASAACKKAEPSVYRPEPPTVGSLSLQIQLAGSIVPEIAYEISSDGEVTRRGTFLPNQKEEIFTAVIGTLPANDRYSIVFDAKAANRQTGQLLPCGGSADFRIIGGQTTVVGILVRCSDVDAMPAPAGSGMMSGPIAAHRCASISAVRALPGEAPVGKQVILKSDVARGDAPSDQLHFEWSANTGTLLNESSAEALFQCTSAGVATITFKLSEAFQGCREERVFVYVTCRDRLEVSSGAEQSGSAGAAGAARSGAGGA